MDVGCWMDGFDAFGATCLMDGVDDVATACCESS